MKKYIIVLVVLVILFFIPSSLPITDTVRIDEAGFSIRFKRVCAMRSLGRLEFSKTAEFSSNSINFSYSTLEAPDFFIIKDTIIIVNYSNYYDVQPSGKDVVMITTDAMKPYWDSDGRYEHIPSAKLNTWHYYCKSYRYIYQYLNSLKLMDSISLDTPIYMISIKESCRGYEIINLKTNETIHEFWDEPLNPYK